MADKSEATVQKAFEAIAAGDRECLLELVDPDLEWTFLDPSIEDPAPQVCHGREQLARHVRIESAAQLEVEELRSYGERVLVVTHLPGLDATRARQSADRNYHVVTVREGRIAALRACRDRDEARSIASRGETT